MRDCPYRYYVSSLLGLRKAKEFEEGFDASLAGQTLHALLRNFFHALKTEEKNSHSLIHSGDEARRQWMIEHLTQFSEKEFERLIAGDARILGTLRDWQKQIPSWVFVFANLARFLRSSHHQQLTSQTLFQKIGLDARSSIDVSLRRHYELVNANFFLPF